MVKHIGIAAVAQNGVIGVREHNEMPWRLGEYAQDPLWNDWRNPDSFRAHDMGYFKKITQGRHLFMGKATWFSIPAVARPLKGRPNHLISKSLLKEEPYLAQTEGVYLHPSIDDALESVGEDAEGIVFMGGHGIYQEAIERNILDGLHIIQIHKDFEGDVLFPPYQDKFERDSRTDLWVHPETKTKATIDIYLPR